MTTDARPDLDLDAYLARVGYQGGLAPTLETLEGLHLAHATRVPFENLDILLGRPIRLDLEGLQAKLVRDRRGGYCFEQNTLLAAALGRVGFRVTTLAARVRWGATRVLPRTHMLLTVDLDEGPWLADVGFGGDGLLKPIALSPGREERQFLWSYRVVSEGAVWVLQSRRDGSWTDLYAFTTEPQYPVDFEMANHFTSTHPSSPFVKGPTVQLPTPDARYIVRGREFLVERGAEVSRLTVKGDEELLRILSEKFGLNFPPDSRFLGPGQPT
jgi:N-hydroxyarylamine O-acetyltransferase